MFCWQVTPKQISLWTKCDIQYKALGCQNWSSVIALILNRCFFSCNNILLYHGRLLQDHNWNQTTNYMYKPSLNKILCCMVAWASLFSSHGKILQLEKNLSKKLFHPVWSVNLSIKKDIKSNNSAFRSSTSFWIYWQEPLNKFAQHSLLENSRLMLFTRKDSCSVVEPKFWSTGYQEESLYYTITKL